MSKCIVCTTETNGSMGDNPLCEDCFIMSYINGPKDRPLGCPTCGETLEWGNEYIRLTADLIHVDIEYLFCPDCHWAAVKSA